MLTIAVAALALSGHPAKQTSFLLPLKNLVADLSGGVVTGQFSLSKNWAIGQNAHFVAYFRNGVDPKISPDAGWSKVSEDKDFDPTFDTDVVKFTVTLPHSENHGAIWIQCTGGPGDSPNGAETSVIATVCNSRLPVSKPGPGTLVPIIVTTPRDFPTTKTVTFTATVNSYTVTTDPDESGFKTWQSNGKNASATPGNGWTSMPNSGFTNGTGTQVKTLGTTNSSSGYYMVSLQELCDEVWMGQTNKWQEFSAVIRPIPTVPKRK